MSSIEAWAAEYVESQVLATKLRPPPRPRDFAKNATPKRIERPGRPPELLPRQARQKSPRPGALVHPKKRAQILHTFFHHELQAAELAAWAVVAFPETPRAFRRGLLKIMEDEVRHANLYAEHLGTLGFPVGSFPVNDWFWSRVAAAETPAHFVATMGLGFEGGNLDHSARFEGLFLRAGDETAAALQAIVGKEEVTHVAFAVRWFERLTGALDFDRWKNHLPPPLTPMMMRGAELDQSRRGRSGMTPAFLERLGAWGSEPSGS